MAVAANLPPHVKHYLAACTQAQINQIVSSLKGVENKRTVAAVVAAGDPTMASGSHSTPSSSNSTSPQASGPSTSQSHRMMSVTSTATNSSVAQPPNTPKSRSDSASTKITTAQNFSPNSSPNATQPDSGVVQGSPLRALNSFMAYRVYYNPIFHAFEQKERSGFMKTMWAEEETKAKWSIIAKAWSVIRDEVGKDSAPLDKFLELACPHIDILPRDTYLSTLGWQLDSSNGNTTLRRIFTPNFDAFPASFRTTTKSVQDVINFVRSSNYAVPSKGTPVLSKTTSTSHLTMAAQPVHHSGTAAGSTFLPSSIFQSAKSSVGHVTAQPHSTSGHGAQQPSSFLGAGAHSTAQTASMTTTTALSQAGSSAHAGVGESGQDNAMDIDSAQQPAQHQINTAMTAQATQTVSTSGNSGSAQGNSAGAQPNHQATVAATQQHTASTNGSNGSNGAGTGGLLTGGPMTHQQMLNYIYGADVEPVEHEPYSPHVDDAVMNPEPQTCVMQRTSLADPDLLAISMNTGNPHQILNYFPASTRFPGNTLANATVRPAPEEDSQTAWVDCALQLMDTSSTFPYAEFFSPENDGLNVFDIGEIPAFTAVDCADFQFPETTQPLVTSQWIEEADDTEQ